MSDGSSFDEIGYWSEIKLDIIKEYAHAYSTILTRKSLSHAYIDAFSGHGLAFSRTTQTFVPGSPLNALDIEPPFRAFYFIDLDQDKAARLRECVRDRRDVHVFEGDCNAILPEEVFPHVRYKDYWRALCLLDPYGLHLDWDVICQAGQMRSIEVFLNFPVMDMNRNVLWHDPTGVSPTNIDRMSRFWGDESWRQIAYSANGGLFPDIELRQPMQYVADAFCNRLRKDAGFKYVSEPLPMRNTQGSVVYFLIFASQQPVAERIVRDIFKKYQNRGK